MRKILLVILYLISSASMSQNDEKVRLLVRGDDMGSSHAANVACIKAAKDGIVRSVEVMVPGPWFEEAAFMLQEDTTIDAGIHLVLTSEWTMVRWRPLTDAVGLRDSNGYFVGAIKPYKDFKMTSYLINNEWRLEEVEKEFRAQIEMAKEKIPQLSHITGHMGCTGFNDQVKDMVRKLGDEYGLAVASQDFNLNSFRGYKKGASKKMRIKQMIASLNNLTPGDYLMVQHPSLDNEEMKNVWHHKNLDVGEERGKETEMLAHRKMQKAISKLDVELISYSELISNSVE